MQTIHARPDKASAQLDLAILSINSPSPLRKAAIAPALPKVGAKVYAIGSPLALEGTISEGILSQIRRDNVITLIQTTAPISPGSSGGGLFSETGELLGITTMSIVGGQNLNFALPCQDLSPLTAVSTFAKRSDSDSQESPTMSAAVGIGGVKITLGMPTQLFLIKLPKKYNVHHQYMGDNKEMIYITEKVENYNEHIGYVTSKAGKVSYASASWPTDRTDHGLASLLSTLMEHLQTSEGETIIRAGVNRALVPNILAEWTEIKLQNGKSIKITALTYEGEKSVSVDEIISSY